MVFPKTNLIQHVGYIDQCFYTEEESDTSTWDNILDRTMSTPIPWRKYGINIISLVVYFRYKLLFKTQIRKLQILNEGEKYKLDSGKVYSSEYILQHESSLSEHTPDLLIKFNNYVMETITDYYKLINKAKSYIDIREQLHRFTQFLLAGIYRPVNIHNSNKYKKISLRSIRNPEWVIFIHIGRSQRQLHHGGTISLGKPLLYELDQSSMLTRYLARSIHGNQHEHIHTHSFIDLNYVTF